MTRPLFISLDGIDGTGKSTQCQALAQWLRQRGHDVVECADPGGTAVGQVLRDLLLSRRHHLSLPCEALLFMASRAQLVAEVIRPALESGRSVVCDRFLLANVVYQGHAGGLDPALLWQVGRLATDDLLPDLTVVLDLTLEEAQARRKPEADRLESRGADYHERVRAGFLEEASRHSECVVVVDASAAADVVQERIRSHVARLWG